MQKSNDKIKGILLGAITGDALGTPLDGLSKAHINAVLKKIDNFTDPSPALKGKMQNWKKPGLYSFNSQFFILLSLYVIKQKHNFNLIEILKNNSNENGLFRHPSSMAKCLIKAAKNPLDSAGEIYSGYCADPAVLLAPYTIFSEKYNDYEINFLSLLTTILKEINSIAGALLFNVLLKKIIEKNINTAENVLLIFKKECNLLINKLGENTGRIFDFGINPDYLISSLQVYEEIFKEIEEIKNIADSEKIIINRVNRELKTPVTRATINNPLAVIPFSVALTYFYSDSPADIIFRAAEQGGSVSILCALTGILTGSLFGHDSINENLLKDLINKKRIFALVDSVINKKIPDEFMNDFLLSEKSLTLKETDERNARLKHIKIKARKTQSRKEAEKEITTHVVESWTKMDKAKWRKKLSKNPDVQ